MDARVAHEEYLRDARAGRCKHTFYCADVLGRVIEAILTLPANWIGLLWDTMHQVTLIKSWARSNQSVQRLKLRGQRLRMYGCAKALTRCPLPRRRKTAAADGGNGGAAAEDDNDEAGGSCGCCVTDGRHQPLLVLEDGSLLAQPLSYPMVLEERCRALSFASVLPHQRVLAGDGKTASQRKLEQVLTEHYLSDVVRFAQGLNVTAPPTFPNALLSTGAN
jgi:hypothetical protein